MTIGRCGDPMELLVFVLALAVLSVLAIRYGHDSRPGPESKEEALADLGLCPDEATPPQLADGHLTPGERARTVTRLSPQN